MTSSNENAEQSPSEKETNVDERFHIKMKSLMTELQLDGKMLLACAWTTIEESRRFKIAPWVSTWDVAEGLNSEARPFLWVLMWILTVKAIPMLTCFYPPVKCGCSIGRPKFALSLFTGMKLCNAQT